MKKYLTTMLFAAAMIFAPLVASAAVYNPPRCDVNPKTAVESIVATADGVEVTDIQGDQIVALRKWIGDKFGPDNLVDFDRNVVFIKGNGAYNMVFLKGCLVGSGVLPLELAKEAIKAATGQGV